LILQSGSEISDRFGINFAGRTCGTKEGGNEDSINFLDVID
jgi:hypothetical protein